MSFQRARSPEQKEERRAQLLTVASEMLHAELLPSELSLNELARRAGMAKSNVYRYFESREALLLELLSAEWLALFDPAVLDLGQDGEPPLELAELTERFARAVASRPLLGRLLSVLPSTLEHNVTVETIREFKRSSLALAERAARLFHCRAPELSREQHFELLSEAIVLVTGLWPHAHPAPAVAEALKAPELSPFRHDFERDLARSLLLLARGIAGSEARAASVATAPKGRGA